MREWLGSWFDAVEYHHEHWDGNGSPHGLAGAAIPLAGRIVAVADVYVAVADVYDVITATRSYKKAQSAVDARAELARCAGSQFDPGVVRAFLGISLGRMRLMLGPLTWLNELPGMGRVPLAQAGTAISAFAAGATMLLGGFIPTNAPPVTPVVAAPSAMVARAVDAPVDTVAESPSPSPAATPPVPVAAAASVAPPPDVPTPTTTTTPPATAPTPPPEALAPTPTPPAPVLAADSAAIDEDTPATIDVLANDSRDGLTLTGVSQPVGASVTIDQGHLAITPAPDFDGQLQFCGELGSGRDPRHPGDAAARHGSPGFRPHSRGQMSAAPPYLQVGRVVASHRGELVAPAPCR